MAYAVLIGSDPIPRIMGRKRERQKQLPRTGIEPASFSYRVLGKRRPTIRPTRLVLIALSVIIGTVEYLIMHKVGNTPNPMHYEMGF